MNVLKCIYKKKITGKGNYILLIDLQLDSEMEPTVALLHATVVDTYRRLKLLVEDVKPEELLYKGPDGNMNSIGQLIRHLAVVDLHWAYRFKQKPIPLDIKEKYGPLINEYDQLPAVANTTITDLINKYDRVQKTIYLECRKLIGDDLNIAVNYENGNSATIRWGIWHIADHSRYHQAHISLLRKYYRSNGGLANNFKGE